MFERFKQPEEDLQGIVTEIKELQKSIRELKKTHSDEITTLRKEMEGYSTRVKNAAIDLEKAPALLEHLAQTAGRVEASTKGLQQQILQRFEKELGQELVTLSGQLRTEKQAYEKIKQEIEGLAKTALSLREEIKRLHELAAGIKKEDFTLSEHHRNLIQEDQNKVELLAKIDQLERMIANMKRGGGQGQRR